MASSARARRVCEVQALLVGPNEVGELVNLETRIEILAVLEDRYTSRSRVLTDALWKARFQRRFLTGLCVGMAVLIGVGWWRYLYIEKTSLARSWTLLNERQVIAAKTGKEAAKGAMVWCMDRIREVDADPTATPTEKVLWKRNIMQISEQINIRYLVAEETERRLSAYSAPDRIDAFTYLKDPYTGRTLPLNATRNGRIDRAAFDAYAKGDDLLIRLVATAKRYSQRGAEPLPPFVFDPQPKGK
jgi:hypothetical protein